jgi:hypothetical protein
VVKLLLRDNIKLNVFMELEESTIVGFFLSKHMNGESLKVWKKQTFFTVLSYSPLYML